MTPTRWRFEASNGPAERLREANDALESLLRAHGASARARFAARLVCEEVVLNALEHGGARFVTLEVDPTADPNQLIFEDDGAVFDPGTRGIPAAPKAPREVGTRGRGLIFVRGFTRSIKHRLVDGRNRLTVRLAE